MKSFSSLFTLIFLSFFLHDNSAEAGFYRGEYRLGLYKDNSLDTSKITHVIVVGSAVKEDSDGMFQSGLGRAARYKEVWPSHQVVIMSSPEVRGKKDKEVFEEFNIPVTKKIDRTFTPEILISELGQFTKIASIDFYGHSSPWALKLGKSDAALDPEAYHNQLKNLRSHFLPTASITLNSCNSGFKIAPALSLALAIPVAGSLTSSVLERTETDGMWYKEDDWTNENYLNCDLGTCWRMKPTHASYSAYWGHFKEGGLSFYKFFCNFENTEGKCAKAMATSLLGFPSIRALSEKPSVEDFKMVAFDWICSTYKNKQKFNECVEGINQSIIKGDLRFQTHPGTELNCNFKTCNAKVVCKEKIFGNGPKGGSCKLVADITGPATNAATELLEFMKGYDLLLNP